MYDNYVDRHCLSLQSEDMNIMKKKQMVGLLLAATMCLSGCGNAAIKTDTLSLSGNGTATYTIISDFTKDYYNLEELTTMAQEEVLAYGSGVQITEAVVEEGMLNFQYTFDSLSHYAAFMGTSCYQATVGQALKAGYKSDTQLISAKDGSSILMKDEAIQGYQLFVWNESVAVRCDGNVLYYSSNLSTSGKRDVVPKEEAGGPYYVIYK